MSARTPQAGFGLVETLLTLGALSALSVAIYAALGPTSAAAQTKREQDNLRDLSTSVTQSFGLLGNFAAVSTSRVVEDGLAPTRMRDGDDLRTAWGTGVDLAPVSIRGANDGFVVVYPLAPAGVCTKLAAAVVRDVYDLRVDGTSVMDVATGRLDVNATAARCGASDAATMEFVFHSGLVSGGVVATPPLSLPPAPPGTPPPASTPVDVPIGPVAPVSPPAALPPVVVAPPPAVVPPPPAAPPPGGPITPITPPVSTPPPGVSPPPGLTRCAPPPPTSGDRTLTCAAGQFGTHAQHRTGTYACPEAWDDPVLTWQGWTTVANTCTGCPAPAPETVRQWVAASGTCAAGQWGRRTWDKEQARTRTRSYTCPAGTTSLPPPAYTPWSAWTDTGATRGAVNGCAACPAPATQTDTPRWVDSSAACPTGQSGSHTWEKEQTRTRTRSYTCPAAQTTLPDPTYTPWSAWSDTGRKRGEVNTCAPTCAPPVGSSGVRVRWFITCAANTGNYGGPSPDWNALKAALPSGTQTTVQNHAQNVANGNWGWNCQVTRGGVSDIQVSGTNSTFSTYSWTYAEVEWNGVLYTGAAGEQTANADQCDMRGNQRVGDCSLGFWGSMPPGIAMGQLVNVPSTVHAYFYGYSCPAP